MRALPEGLTSEDYEISATIRDLGRLERVLDRVPPRHPRSLIDFGCGIGGLTRYVGARVGAHDLYGVDRDPERLATAAARGVRTFDLDLNSDAIPLGDASVEMAISFGAFEHIVFYDNTLSEAARVLTDGAPFVISMPNLGSYVNRLALFLGYQPREVEVSWQAATGMLPFYRRADAKGAPLGHVHSATLRCMRQLLEHFGFGVEHATGFSPDFGSRLVRAGDAVFGRIPSLSRRFILLARRRPRGFARAVLPSETPSCST